MKRLLTVVAIFSLILLGFGAVAMADTIMFPYINENPGNVSTLISVVNGSDCTNPATPGPACAPVQAIGALHYRYVTKPNQLAAESLDTWLLDRCTDYDFCRATSLNDVVTFDAAGNINTGNAMFNDPGAGLTGIGTQVLYGGAFDDTQAPPRRGYLLVTHHRAVGFGGVACGGGDLTNGLGGDSVNTELDGEAVLIDIVAGEAWSYKAMLNTTTGLGAAGNYAFRTSDERLVEDNHSFWEQTVIFPPEHWTTRYIVTPLEIQAQMIPPAPNIPADDDMANMARQKRTRMSLNCWTRNVIGAEPIGVFDRNEVCLSGSIRRHIRCVGAIDLVDLIGTANRDTINTTGGWATVDLTNPPPIAAEGEIAVPIAGATDSFDAFVFDLRYANQQFGATGWTNDAKVVRSNRAGAPRIGAGAD